MVVSCTILSLKLKLHQHGFTLIELLVAITIMMLLLGTGIVSYLRFNDRQGLVSGAQELSNVLRAAQTRARLGDRPAGCERLELYAVRMSVESSTVTSVAECENGSFARSEQTLTAGTRAVDAIDVQFKVLHGGVINAGEILLESPQGMRYSLFVEEGGQVTTGGIVEN